MLRRMRMVFPQQPSRAIISVYRALPICKSTSLLARTSYDCVCCQITLCPIRQTRTYTRNITTTTTTTTTTTRYRAEYKHVYSLTFCFRVMSPEHHHWKPAVQAAAVMLRTPLVDCQSPASQPRPLAIYGAQF